MCQVAYTKVGCNSIYIKPVKRIVKTCLGSICWLEFEIFNGNNSNYEYVNTVCNTYNKKLIKI